MTSLRSNIMKVFCLLILLTLPILIFCQPKIDEPLFRIWDNDGKEGFIDVSGKVVIKPQFDTVGEFSEGFAPVLIDGKWGYINRKGEVVIQPRWEESKIDWERRPMVQSFQDGLAIVIEEINIKMMEGSYRTYKCGYINAKGEYVIQPKFRQSCGVFSEGLAQIKVDILGDEYEKEKGAIGFINKKGDWAIKPQFVEAGSFVNGSAQVRDDYYKSFYSIDKTGYKVEGKIDCRSQYSFTEGLALVYDEKTGVKFINEQCKEVLKILSDITTLAGEFSEGMLIVGKEINGNKMLGYLDRTGKVVIDFKFAKAQAFSDGLAGVVINEGDKNYNAYINKTGEIVLKNTRGIAPFKNGLALQFLKLYTISERPIARNIRGYLNKQGKYVWLSPRAENYLDKDWIQENFIK